MAIVNFFKIVHIDQNHRGATVSFTSRHFTGQETIEAAAV